MKSFLGITAFITIVASLWFIETQTDLMVNGFANLSNFTNWVVSIVDRPEPDVEVGNKVKALFDKLVK